jgi:arginyl-tRNA synthetase
MMTLNPIKKDLSDIITKSFEKSFSCGIPDIQIDKPKQDNFGDYSSNLAMISTKLIGIPPRKIADKIVENLPKNNIIESVKIEGPGFINFFLKKEYIEKMFHMVENDASVLKPNVGSNEKVVIEYSQPNIAKPLGVHHILSTIIGQSLSNIYEYINFDVKRVNHIGDWGTQFGKLIYAYKTWGDRKVIDENPIDELLKLYVKFHNEAEKNKNLDDEGRLEFKKLEDGDKENIDLWKWIRDISLREVKATYDKLEGITFRDEDYIGESFYNDKMADIIAQGLKKNIFKLSDEALIAEIDETTPPLLVQKKDGTTLYATRDLSQIRYRTSLGIKKNIMVVDTAQSLHFRQVFHVAKALGYEGNGAVDLMHVVFGRMSLPDKNMSTRKGNVILLDDLIDEAIDRAYKLVSENAPNLDEDEKNYIARISGIGSIKYNVLSQNRVHNITFIWDNMISLDGNCAPYLQYTHARARSILRKNTESLSDKFEITESIESSLVKKILDFPDVLKNSQETNMPHHVAIYIYELATIFNTFYNSYPVLKSSGDVKNTRLKLVDMVSKILKISLNLMTIEAPEKM